MANFRRRSEDAGSVLVRKTIFTELSNRFSRSSNGRNSEGLMHNIIVYVRIIGYLELYYSSVVMKRERRRTSRFLVFEHDSATEEAQADIDGYLDTL